MKRKLFVSISLFILTGLTVFAQTPKLPYKDTGACPFECCEYRQWIANKDTTIYKEMRDGSPIAFKIKRREKVTGVTGVVITTKAGQVKALKSFTTPNTNVPVKANDTLYLLTYRGEGFYLIWYKGKEFVDEVYEQNETRILSEPEAIWWVKVKNRRGQVGWTKLPENFDNKDACGSASEVEGDSPAIDDSVSSTKTNYQAIVDATEAFFTFPLNPTQEYVWCPGGLQYAWAVKVNSNNQDYELGYFMYTAQGASPCGQGNIQRLLKEGQFSLWKQDAESGSLITGLTGEGFATYEDNYSDDFLLEKIMISGVAARNKLTVKLSGAKTIQKLFGNRPKQLTFTSQIKGSGESVNIPVIYTSKFLAAQSGSPLNSPAKNKKSTCLTNNEAGELIAQLIPSNTFRYSLEDALSYKPIESLTDIKTDFPVAYLFYQKGYFRMEEGGYVFQYITSKGENLRSQFPEGFPLATKTLVSIDKVSCIRKKLRVNVTYKINPTPQALEVLGDDVYTIKPFNQVWKTGVEFISKEGKWTLPDNFYLSPRID